MQTLKLLMKWLFGLLFIVAGANHFRDPEFYVPMMPPYLPWHRELVYVSGACEIALGALLLVPACSPYAANLHMALHPEQFTKFSERGLWLRLPVQGVLIAWAYWFTGGEGGK
jgi:uncharacterized membrane protein